MSEQAALTADLTADKAAIMVMLLDEVHSARILSELDPRELRLLGEKMVALGEIGPDVIAGAITGFVETSEAMGITAHARREQVHTMMTRAVGEVKADNLMHRIAPEASRTSPLELARWLVPSAIVPLIAGEHPQVIAVLLVQLEAEIAAQVLHALPETEQAEIVHRVATLGPVAPHALAMLDDLLTRRITKCHGRQALTMGGVREAAGIINGVGKLVEKRVMGEIGKADKKLAKLIEEEMFKFEHLFVLDPQAMGALLRDTPNETLIDALKGVSEDEREVFFRAMSSRAADGVKDEIAARGRVKLADVVAAQKAVVATARRLATEGVLVFGSGDDDYV